MLTKIYYRTINFVLVASLLIGQAVPTYAQNDTTSNLITTAATVSDAEKDPYSLEEANASIAEQSVTEMLLQFRILEVTAVDETNPEVCYIPFKVNCESDDMALAGTALSRYGMNKIPYTDLGDFDDGDTRQYYANPWVFHEFLLSDFPQKTAITLLLAEIDHLGGANQALDDLYSQEHDKVRENVDTSIVAANTHEPITAAIIAAVAVLATKLIEEIWNVLSGSLKDDLFYPSVQHITIPTVTARWDGATTSPPVELRFLGHGGEYKIVYDWNMIFPNEPEQITSSTANEWGSTPWYLVQRRFPVHYWANSNISLPAMPVNIVAKHSGKCLDVDGVSTDNGAIVKQWDCLGAGQTNQLWYLKPIGNYFQIIAVHSGKCLDIEGVSVENEALAHQWDCIGATQLNQLWAFRAVGDAYQIIPAHSGSCLDIRGGSYDIGAVAHQWKCVGASQTNQLWYIIEVQPPIPQPTATPIQPTSTPTPQTQYQFFLPIVSR